MFPRSVAIVLMCACGGIAQVPAPQADPARGQQTERRPTPVDVEGELQRGRARGRPIPPSDAEGKPIWEPDSSTTADLLWREGFQFAMRRGRLQQAGDQWSFDFSQDAEGRQDRPIGILPNSKLQQMRAYAAARGSEASFAVTGRATEYRGRNYILIRDVAILTGRGVDRQTAVGTAPQALGDDASGDSILDQLQHDARSARPLEPLKGTLPEPDVPMYESPPPSVAPTNDLSRLWPEDYRLDRRPGRLIKQPDGWIFAFESNSTRPAEPPVRVLPNLALEQMERYAAGGARSLVFIVSGTITHSDGHNYLLIRQFTVRRGDGNLH